MRLKEVCVCPVTENAFNIIIIFREIQQLESIFPKVKKY